MIILERKHPLIGIPYDYTAGPLPYNQIESGHWPPATNCQRALQLFHFATSGQLLHPEQVYSSNAFFDPNTEFLINDSPNPYFFEQLASVGERAFLATIFALRRRTGRADPYNPRKFHLAVYIGGEELQRKLSELDSRLIPHLDPNTCLIFEASYASKASRFTNTDQFCKNYLPIAAKTTPQGLQLPPRRSPAISREVLLDPNSLKQTQNTAPLVAQIA